MDGVDGSGFFKAHFDRFVVVVVCSEMGACSRGDTYVPIAEVWRMRRLQERLKEMVRSSSLAQRCHLCQSSSFLSAHLLRYFRC